MALIAGHVHDAAPPAWPFAELTNTQASSNARVVHEKRPALLVVHDDEGDWLFLCGSEDLREALIVWRARTNTNRMLEPSPTFPWAGERGERA